MYKMKTLGVEIARDQKSKQEKGHVYAYSSLTIGQPKYDSVIH